MSRSRIEGSVKNSAASSVGSLSSVNAVNEFPSRDELRIGVSSCLLGEEVRFDGGHKLNHFLTDTLSEYVQFVEVCPEVGIGLGIPRESLRLVQIGKPGEPPESGDANSPPRMIANKSGADHTDAMNAWSEAKVSELEKLDLSGYVLKSKSPSCGMERVTLYRGAKGSDAGAGGTGARDGVGLFAAVLLRRMPLLPVEEEGRLRDPRLRENFIERMFAYRRVKMLFQGPWTVGDLVAFHTHMKLLVLAHHRPAYQELGHIVAHAKGTPRDTIVERYTRIVMEALKMLATTRKQTNVLQHMAGYFKRVLDEPARRELASTIEDFHAGLVPLVVPLTLIRHYVRLHKVQYLAEQFYLEPSPKELMLRNHV